MQLALRHRQLDHHGLRHARRPFRGATARALLRRVPVAAGLLASILAGATVRALDDAPLWPGARYAPDVPTMRQVLGYGPGERISSPAEILRYLDALARARPQELRVVDYARSWEGRRLAVAILGSPEILARLDGIEDGIRRLADPRNLGRDEAAAVAAQLPVTVYLEAGVHGNEISSPEAALMVAYHLLAAQGDPIVASIRSKALVFIDPLQNPDGRERFVQHYHSSEGLVPDRSPLAVEHDEPWPGGRTNHSLFDLNRDWFAMTQPETVGRIGVLRRWQPLVVVDLHEMSGNSTYFFPPNAAPANPQLTDEQLAAQEVFGRNNARWFDRFGFDYFTREVYDTFYPGYADSWPAFYGAVAMTYEMASARGLVWQRSDGTLLSFRDGIQRHFVASISTLEAATEHADELWSGIIRYRRSATIQGEHESLHAYVLPRRGDTSSVDKLAALLVQQGVTVERSSGALRACTQELPAGSYVVPLAQPANRLIHTLLDAQIPLDETFLAEQERRRAKRLGDEIYDVTAWSLPLMFGVEALTCDLHASAALEPASGEAIIPGRVTGPAEAVAWIVPWGTTASGRLLASALRQELDILSPERPFTMDGRRFPAGSLVFTRHRNGADLPARLQELARTSGAEVVASATSWVDEGVNFGSRNSRRLTAPRVALAWDRPTSPYAAGAARFILERQYGYPVTAIRVHRLARADLSGFDVLVLPDAAGEAGYGDALDREALQDWVRNGGALVALGGGAVRALSLGNDPLLATHLERAAGEDDSQPTPAQNGRIPGQIFASPADYLDAIRAPETLPDPAPGALVRAAVDPDHWICAGLDSPLHVLIRDRDVFSPLTLDRGTNAVLFAAADDLVASGHLWDENRRQLASKPFVMVQQDGRGLAIGFTADPTVRAYLDGLDLLLLNAIFRGAAHAGQPPP